MYLIREVRIIRLRKNWLINISLEKCWSYGEIYREWDTIGPKDCSILLELGMMIVIWYERCNKKN